MASMVCVNGKILFIRLFRKSDIQFIQPLTETLKRDLNVVHVGGLTVLPAKKVSDFLFISEHLMDKFIRRNWTLKS